MLVSGGQRETSYVMPYFIGANEIEVQHRLDQTGLRHKTNYVAASQWPHGTVIDQSPLGGSRIPANTEVELTIAN
jgi:beta-lactam-binding protein with PASTA domain